MQVLKFGGSSVANAENIKKVIAVLKERTLGKKTIVVVSALGGITDLLLTCSNLAAQGHENYQANLSEIEERHLQTVMMGLEDYIITEFGNNYTTPPCGHPSEGGELKHRPLETPVREGN